MNFKMSICGVLGAFLAVVPLGAQQDRTTDVDLDHVILGIDSLRRGIERFAALTGVTPQPGGQHPGRGTENALVSLGAGHYLEILSPIAPQPGAAGDPRTRHEELTLAGWALHTRALANVVTRLRAAGFAVADPTPGSRRTPDGTLLQWQTAAVTGPGLELAPFFIEWAEGSAHPSSSSPAGCRLVSVELVHPDAQRLTAFFAAAGYAASVRTGNAPGGQLVLSCPRGRIVFSSR
jgi:hypothetical protein